MLYYVESGDIKQEIEEDSPINAAVAFVTKNSVFSTAGTVYRDDFGLAISVSLVPFGKRKRKEIWFSTESLLDEIKTYQNGIIRLPDPEQPVAQVVGD